MAFPPKEKPKAALAISIGDDEAPEAESPDADMPSSAKAASAKAFYTAAQEGDWEAAAEALGQFVDSHDDEGMEPDGDEGAMPPESSPF